jgi:hypothetical protein
VILSLGGDEWAVAAHRLTAYAHFVIACAQTPFERQYYPKLAAHVLAREAARLAPWPALRRLVLAAERAGHPDVSTQANIALFLCLRAAKDVPVAFAQRRVASAQAALDGLPRSHQLKKQGYGRDLKAARATLAGIVAPKRRRRRS